MNKEEIDAAEVIRKDIIKEKRKERLVIARARADELRKELRNEKEKVEGEKKVKKVKEIKLTKIEQHTKRFEG